MSQQINYQDLYRLLESNNFFIDQVKEELVSILNIPHEVYEYGENTVFIYEYQYSFKPIPGYVSYNNQSYFYQNPNTYHPQYFPVNPPQNLTKPQGVVPIQTVNIQPQSTYHYFLPIKHLSFVKIYFYLSSDEKIYDFQHNFHDEYQ